jgi:RecA-family ATPase
VAFRDPNSTATATGTSSSSSSGDGDRHRNDILLAALTYAKRGWAVLPLWWVRTDGRCACDSQNCDSVGKHPIGKPGMAPNGVNSATDDPDMIRTWWRRYPLANVGIATGERSSLWVLDVDGPEGAATLTDLEHRHGSLPISVMAQTGGGQHRVFSFHGENIKNRVKDIGDGLDVRATGGYIVAPPSIHRNGTVYQWEAGFGPDEIELADAPPWLIEQVSGGNRRQRERPPDQDRQQDRRSMNGHGQHPGGSVDAWAAKALHEECRAVAQAGKGCRNNQLNLSAYSLGQLVGGKHLDRDPVVNALLDAATDNNLVADEGKDRVMATINSGLNAGMATPRKKPDPEPQTEQKRQDAGSKANGADGSAGKAGDGVEDDAAKETGSDGGDILAEFTDPTKLVGIGAPDREWIVEGWLPVGTVTSLYGTGGVGKTLLAQLLQSAVGTGRPFLGIDTKQCKVLSVFCEDDSDELHRRQVCINASMGIGMQDLGAVRWQSRFGKENVMATIDGGLLKQTKFYEFVRAAAKQSGARLVIIDNIAQVFAGNENIRAEVTQFVNSLGTIAQEIKGAVLLLGHPGKADNSEYSGSTAWDACVRSRWILERPKEDLDEQDAGELADLRVLRRAKANYARKDDEIPMRWEAGTFRREGPARFKDAVDRIEERLQEKADEEAFLACLDTLREQGRAVSDSRNAQTYAPKAMFNTAQTTGIPKRRLERAMERLFAAGIIKAGMQIGTKANRHPLVGIGRAEVASRPAPEFVSECAGVAPEFEPDFAETAPEPAPNPATARVSELAPEFAPECAPECAGVAPDPSENRIDTAPECATQCPLYTTYIEGGTSGAVPPSDDDTVKAAAAAMRRVDAVDETEATKPEHPANGSPEETAEPALTASRPLTPNLVIEEYDA